MLLSEYVAGNPCAGLDPSGQFYIDLPATPRKCQLVAGIMKLYADVRQLGTYDKKLLDHYLGGSGTDLTLGMDAFDDWGFTRSALREEVKSEAIQVAKSLACGKSTTRMGRKSGIYGSNTVMIHKYTMKTNYTYQVRKKCCGPCYFIHGRIWLNYEAIDRTDFHPGDAFGFFPIYVDSDLFLACNLGKPFDISAHSSDNDSFVHFACR